MPTVLAQTVSDWQTMTRAVNETKSPASWLRNRLFPTSRQFLDTTEKVEFGIWRGDREIAPFVRKGSAALMVDAYPEEHRTIEHSNIRIKRPQTLDNLAFQRRVGSGIFVSGNAQHRAWINAARARDLQKMMDMVENTEEWMAAQVLRGALTYSYSDQESITIDFRRSVANSTSAGSTWGTAGSTAIADIRKAERTVHDATQLRLTDAFMGADAADKFMSDPTISAEMQRSNGGSNEYMLGMLTQEAQRDGQGGRFLGRLMGINFWEYSRSLELPSGSSEKLLRDNYVEFVANVDAAMFEMRYGPIPDWDAFGSGQFVSRRFAKQFVTPDPSVLTYLIHTRPLTVVKRPDATYSLNIA